MVTRASEFGENYVFYLFILNLLILESQRERDINLLFHLFMHSLVDSCMCLDWASNLHSMILVFKGLYTYYLAP